LAKPAGVVLLAEEGNEGKNSSFGTSFEDKYKMNMFEIERRLVKLESAVKDILNVMEDVEDSVNVEQAGAAELKKMLEEKMKQGPAQASTSISMAGFGDMKAVNARLDAIQNRIGSLEKIKDDVSFLKSRIGMGMQPAESGNAANAAVGEIATAVSSDVRDDIEELKEGMSELSDSVQKWQREVESLKAYRGGGAGDGGGSGPGQSVQSTQAMQRQFFDQLNALRSQMRNMHDEMGQVRAEMEHGMSRMVRGDTGTTHIAEKSDGQVNRQIETLKKRMSEIEDSMQSFAAMGQAGQVQAQQDRGVRDFGPSMYEEAVNTLLEKIVFLESRVSALQQLVMARGGRTAEERDVDRELSSRAPRALIME